MVSNFNNWVIHGTWYAWGLYIVLVWVMLSVVEGVKHLCSPRPKNRLTLTFAPQQLTITHRVYPASRCVTCGFPTTAREAHKTKRQQSATPSPVDGATPPTSTDRET